MLSQQRLCVRLALAAILTTSVVAPVAVRAQSGADDPSRGLGDLGFVDLRPLSAKPASNRKKPTYRRTTPTSPGTPATPAGGSTATLVGVTLWRLRPSAAGDGSAARMLVQEEVTPTSDGVWTPERVDLDTALSEGQHVRFAIETPRDGYLYVLDREIYANGAASPAYAIFPTTRTRGGDNRVRAGGVVEIPALSDDRAYFTVRRSRPDQIAEEFTIVVSPTPLASVRLDSKPQRIADADFETWRRQYGGPVERVDLVDGVGGVYSPAEKAGASGGRLTQDDPPPQTIFRVTGKADAPALVSFRLKYGA
jgi:hypothetical protein